MILQEVDLPTSDYNKNRSHFCFSINTWPSNELQHVMILKSEPSIIHALMKQIDNNPW